MIKTTREGGTTIFCLSRPEKANALTFEMLSELNAAVRAETAPVIVLTGEGQVFSAGADLDAARAGLATSPVWEELSGAIAGYPGLTVAALNGTAAGGAMGMVLACDLRVAADHARFFYPVMALGFLPQPSDPGRMEALVGPARAKRILMAGEKIDSKEARDWGLVDAVVPAGEVMPQAQSWAAAPARAKPGHAAAIKALF